MKPSEPAADIVSEAEPGNVTAAPLSDADLERAIVAAMLDGRGAVAEMLADRLKARRHAAAGVVELATSKGTRRST